MFIENFQGTYERLSTAETLKTIKQKHDESLRDYVKHFCNARNNISRIQDIEIINAFRDGVSDIKTMEEIAMKKPKMVDDLLVVADICIEASEAWARLLESHGKGPSKKGMTGRSTLQNEEIRRIIEALVPWKTILIAEGKETLTVPRWHRKVVRDPSYR
jgi:hypothetical protein